MFLLSLPCLDDMLDEEALILKNPFWHERLFGDRLDPVVFFDDYLHERYQFSGDGICLLVQTVGSSAHSWSVLHDISLQLACSYIKLEMLKKWRI